MHNELNCIDVKILLFNRYSLNINKVIEQLKLYREDVDLEKKEDPYKT